MSDPTTAFAISRQNSTYSIGDGSDCLSLYKCDESSYKDKFMPVKYVTWSDDTTFLVTAGLGTKFSV